MDNTTLGLMILQIMMILLLAGVVLETIIAVYLAKIYRKLDPSGIASASSPDSVPARVPESGERAAQEREQPMAVELLQGYSSMAESIQALAGKYGLEAFTLATRDGLVVASSSSSSQEDAATYSHLFTKGENPSDPHVQLFGILHRGSSLVGIIKSNQTISESGMKSIEDDVKVILDRWL